MEFANSMNVEYHSIFRGLPSLVVILDTDLKIVDVSDAYNQATMTRREEMLGKTMFEVFPDNPGDSKADGMRNLNASLRAGAEVCHPRYDGLFSVTMCVNQLLTAATSTSAIGR